MLKSNPGLLAEIFLYGMGAVMATLAEAILFWVGISMMLGSTIAAAWIYRSKKLAWPIVIVGFAVIAIFVLSKAQPNTKPASSYFTLAQAVTQSISQGVSDLTVSVKNNDIPAEKIVTRLLVLRESLSPIVEPLHDKCIEHANPVGHRGILHRHLEFNVSQNMRPEFVVFQMRYTDKLNNESHLQDFLFRFHESSQDGAFTGYLISATSDESNRIEQYMRARNIQFDQVQSVCDVTR